MDGQTMFTLETAQLLISLAALALAGLVLRDAWMDKEDAQADATLSADAVTIAKERLITALFLSWMALFLVVSGAFAVALARSTAVATSWYGQDSLAFGAWVSRLVWRTSVFCFAFVRWSVRTRLRREVQAKRDADRDLSRARDI